MLAICAQQSVPIERRVARKECDAAAVRLRTNEDARVFERENATKDLRESDPGAITRDLVCRVVLVAKDATRDGVLVDRDQTEDVGASQGVAHLRALPVLRTNHYRYRARCLAHANASALYRS